MRDGVLNRARRRARRVLAPERLDHLVARDDLAGVQEQEGEQRAVLRAAQRQRDSRVDDFHRAEDPEFHARVVAPIARREQAP
jgi:hypothetical protein